MKDNELKNHKFKCPQCGNSGHPVLSNTQVHGQKIRLCPAIGCAVGWPADEDHLYMTKISVLPPKPTEQWLREHNVRLKEPLPRESKGGEFIVNWSSADAAARGEPYTEVYRNTGPNGGCWGKEDPFGGKRYIVEPILVDPYKIYNDALANGKRVFCLQTAGPRQGKMLELSEARAVNGIQAASTLHITEKEDGANLRLFIEGPDIPKKRPAPEGYEHINECRQVKPDEYMLSNDAHPEAWDYSYAFSLFGSSLPQRWILKKSEAPWYQRFKYAQSKGAEVYCFMDGKDIHVDDGYPVEPIGKGYAWVPGFAYVIAGVDVPQRPTVTLLKRHRVVLTGACRKPRVDEYWLSDEGCTLWKGANCVSLGTAQTKDGLTQWVCNPNECVTFEGRRWIVKAAPEAAASADECDTASRQVVTKTKEILTNLVDVLNEAGY